MVLSRLASDDEDGNHSRVAQRAKCLAKLQARKEGHSKVQENAVRSMFESQGKSFRRIACIDDFILALKSVPDHPAHRFIIIND